jgi:N utilization substance protein B
MGQQRKSREGALQVLYQLEALAEPSSGEGLATVPAIQIDIALDRFFDNFDAPDKGADQTRALVHGVVGRVGEIDGLVEKHSPRWKLTRMAMVDRNILRIAAFELLTAREVPIRVVLDEAIEIAKRFGNEKSASFVNGVLDPLAHEVRGNESAP